MSARTDSKADECRALTDSQLADMETHHAAKNGIATRELKACEAKGWTEVGRLIDQQSQESHPPRSPVHPASRGSPRGSWTTSHI
jgi:hypothetical protein